MQGQIGETAGKLWMTLGEKKTLPISAIFKTTKEDSVLAGLALGWLAREDKIKLEEKSNAIFVSLTEKEAKIFEKTRK